MPPIASFLRYIYKHPKRTVKADEDREQFLTNWGFTIYRTYYGPDSNKQWERLLQRITDGVAEGLAELDEADKDPDAVTKVLGQFRMDARSDAATLDGLTLQDVRVAFLDGIGGQPMNPEENRPWRLFLLADAQVLQNSDVSLVKVAAPHYDPGEYVPRNGWSGRQRYFGWITMPTTAVVYLYTEVDTFSFEYLAEGPGSLWLPGDMWLEASVVQNLKSVCRDWQSQGS
ncbi:hypothetical protein HBI81_156620 [Parastagonospora nodorum]|nr:hypothetical protein HBH51_220170 [Parastagonospora nodorum]KAH4804402.1 hypothetical protein HBH61_174630 [Parastagonospora nodorum]KAH4924799.1 hypothetical protein HBI79_161670 [Parastagonospora nodorum]KAH4987962.1 hypothetical protein HBI76_087210 [Parastagonospora nodorum]KAH5174403.1 hypothetical protein HBH77_207370 [Parastagonospora nodorum]